MGHRCTEMVDSKPKLNVGAKKNSDCRPFIVGIAGGSGSGKTTLCRLLTDRLGDRSQLISSDWYYHSLDKLAPEQRSKINFDHPDSLDFQLLDSHLRALISGKAIDVPQYDFATHLRKPATTRLEPSPIVLVEGVLVLANELIRPLFDLAIFVEATSDVRLQRRIQRDGESRGRSEASVREQWNTTVAPMHTRFVEPSRQHAHVCVNANQYNEIAVEMIMTLLVARSERAS